MQSKAQPKTSSRQTKSAKPAPLPRSQRRIRPEPDLPHGKLGIIVAKLRRVEGATIAELEKATGWQPHSIRGAISGGIKKKLGLTVTSTPDDKGRIYRIADAKP